ncbi:MAG TPA: TRAP transporter substrate-binding protein [Pseudonocardia sp.]|jgi:tripartite ATP-independent transporter DctP family solute receptor|uniref:TRAP transporter substrate-binding protein n=1 Tax=Pseudonocardia sp. TaxID=60912 RepID=UPI002B4AF62F|nr:TRAP transporter substrate-binding protein [Pseudonocardia sp.]HLU56075.1 TRAP transporter substrate-binding protein [Pseudonocardia sp.]
MRIPKASVVATVAALFAALTGCGFLTGESAPSASDGTCTEQNLRLATIRAEDDPATLAANHFAESVARATDGRITVRVFPNSQLGDFNGIFAGLSSGQGVDLFYEGITIYPTLEGANAFTVVSVPFMWDSYEQLVGVLRSEEFAELFEQAAQQTGVRVIAVEGDAEPRALSANRPIVTPEDMRGLKLRIAQAPMPQEFARALGANPQVVPLADLYLALRQGVVDAQENGAITMINQSLHEVQSHYMPTNYIRDARSWYVNDAWWNGLCAEDREAITQAAIEAGRLNTAEVGKQLTAAEEQLRSTISVVEPDVEAFRAALEGRFDQFDGQLWPEGLLEQTRQIRDAQR